MMYQKSFSSLIFVLILGFMLILSGCTMKEVNMAEIEQAKLPGLRKWIADQDQKSREEIESTLKVNAKKEAGEEKKDSIDKKEDSSKDKKDEITTKTVANGKELDSKTVSWDDYFATKYNEKRLEMEKKIEKENGITTWTTASVVFVPNLNVAQPALVQSFSLRNFLQWTCEGYDPDNVRKAVNKSLAQNSVIDGKYDLYKLDKTRRELIVNEIANQYMADHPWPLVLDAISLDFGLSAPSLAFGDTGEKFDEKVDKDFPQFLFGGGLHWKGIEASAGAMLYRDNHNDFKTQFYFGLSIELYETALNLKKSPSQEAK